MLLRIFMGMDHNDHQYIKSPRMWVSFDSQDRRSDSLVEVPEGVIPLSATRDEAFSLDSELRAINQHCDSGQPAEARTRSIHYNSI